MGNAEVKALNSSFTDGSKRFVSESGTPTRHKKKKKIKSSTSHCVTVMKSETSTYTSLKKLLAIDLRFLSIHR